MAMRMGVCFSLILTHLIILIILIFLHESLCISLLPLLRNTFSADTFSHVDASCGICSKYKSMAKPEVSKDQDCSFSPATKTFM